MSCYMSKKIIRLSKKKYNYLYAKKRITKHKYSLVVEQVSKYPNSDTWIVLGIWREMGWRPVEGFCPIFYHIIVTKYGYDCAILSKFRTWPFIIIIALLCKIIKYAEKRYMKSLVKLANRPFLHDTAYMGTNTRKPEFRVYPIPPLKYRS